MGIKDFMLKQMLKQKMKGMPEAEQQRMISMIEKNPDFFIGHAFFINKPEKDKIEIFNSKIIPLLYEYCQNNTETIKRILLDAGVQIKPTSIKENFQIIAE